MARVTILYEDAASPANFFGLHELLKECAAEALGVARWELKGLEGITRKGNQKLLDDCWRERFGSDGRPVLAVFDDDRVRELPGLNLQPAACRPEVRNAILSKCPFKLAVVLLHRNIESVLKAILECDSTLVPEEARDQVENRKHLKVNERDIVLMNAAGAPKAVRDCILERVPSLKYLVQKAVQAWAA